MTNDQLREQMWDLVYGLLSPEESQAVVARIKSDPQAARLYAEVRLQADLVGEASRVEDSSVVLEVPGSVAARPTPGKVHRKAAGITSAPVQSARTRSRVGTALVGAGATALAALLAVGLFWPQPDRQRIAEQFVVMELEGPPEMTAGLTSKLAVHSSSALGDSAASSTSRPATFDVMVRGRGGEALLRQQIATSAEGRGFVELPGSVVEPGARLEVAPLADQRLAESAGGAGMAGEAIVEVEKLNETMLAADLPVRQDPPVAYFLMAEPVTQADRPTNYAWWGFSSFSGKPAALDSLQPAGNLSTLAVADPVSGGETQYSVVSGVLQPGQMTTAEPLALGFQSSAVEGARLARREEAPQRAGASAAPSATAGRAALVPEAGAQLAQSEVRLRAAKPAAAAAAPAAVMPTAPAKELADFGRFGFGAEKKAQTPAMTSVAAGQPVAIDLPPLLAGKPVLATALSRGVTVAAVEAGANTNKTWDDELSKLGKQVGNQIELDLPPEADGRIQIDLYDRSSTPPQLVQQQFVYREPARKLAVKLSGVKEVYAPGERVQLGLTVVDETGRAAGDTLVGVRVWNEAIIKQAGLEPTLLEPLVRESSAGSTALVHLDKQEVGGFAASFGNNNAGAGTKSVELASNRSLVQGQLDAAVAAAWRERQSVVRTIGGVAVAGGALLLIVVAVLAWRQSSRSVGVMAPALVVSVASLLLGVGWVGWRPFQTEQNFALASKRELTEESAIALMPRESKGVAEMADAAPSASAPPADALAMRPMNLGLELKDQEATGRTAGGAVAGVAGGTRGLERGEGKTETTREALAAEADAEKSSRQAPASLYFNPKLITDAEGRAAIEFVMPPGASEYRLLIDALGHGRFGSHQQLIVGRAAGAK